MRANSATIEEAIAAGYLGVQPRRRPQGFDARYVRDPILSLAKDLVPVGSTMTWAGSDDKALENLGVAVDSRAEARAWIDDLERRGDILHPDVCRRPSDVAEFAERFVPDSLAVLGFGLPADQVHGFLAEHASLGQADGIGVLLREGRPLEPAHRRLGYEPVAVDKGGLGCSWTCNHLQDDVALATGVVPNEAGFIDTAEQAEAVMAFLADPAVGKETGIWRAWLVVRYEPFR
ncbi:MAG TPA: hypothetical protein VM142_06055 [Acidimicrobiales bacterium]|nr:hypothetical protein [Acidimicrobiales bacterium]